MSRRLSWALAALAGLALLAGCGQSEQEKYTSKMKSISTQLTKEERAVKRTGNSLPAVATQFKQYQAVFNRAADKFQGVKAPAKVKDLHQRFIEVVRSFAGTLTPAIQAAEAGDLQRFQTMSSAFTGGLTKFQSQLNALRRDYRARGYKLK
jgi:predicted benzoate:H+ symporter BenE